MPQILDGNATAAAIKAELKERVEALKAKGITPGLGTVLVGDDPASRSYVGAKHRDCAEIGINSIRVDLPGDITQEELDAEIDKLNNDPACTSYIVQLPLPKHLDTNRVLERIAPEKDADGLHPTNLGKLVLNVSEPLDSPLPCTPNGRGITVGRPLGLLLTRREVNATATLAHTGTQNLDEVLREADVIVAAVGVPHVLKAHQVKEGAILLDVGVSRAEDPETGKKKLFGDVSPEAAQKASWVSPNPGGVGPMTRAELLVNVVETAERQAA